MAKSPNNKTTSVLLSYCMGKTLILEEFVLGLFFGLFFFFFPKDGKELPIILGQILFFKRKF